MGQCCDDPMSLDYDDKLDKLKKICPVIECGGNSGIEGVKDHSYRIHQETSFKLQISFFHAEGTEVIPLNPRDYNFIFTFRAQDTDVIYVASHIRGVSTNLFIDGDKVNIILENPWFELGKLLVEYRFLLEDDNFISGSLEKVFEEYSGIKIINDMTKVSRPDGVTMRSLIPNFPVTLSTKVL